MSGKHFMPRNHQMSTASEWLSENAICVCTFNCTTLNRTCQAFQFCLATSDRLDFFINLENFIVNLKYIILTVGIKSRQLLKKTINVRHDCLKSIPTYFFVNDEPVHSQLCHTGEVKARAINTYSTSGQLPESAMKCEMIMILPSSHRLKQWGRLCYERFNDLWIW